MKFVSLLLLLIPSISFCPNDSNIFKKLKTGDSQKLLQEYTHYLQSLPHTDDKTKQATVTVPQSNKIQEELRAQEAKGEESLGHKSKEKLLKCAVEKAMATNSQQ